MNDGTKEGRGHEATGDKPADRPEDRKAQDQKPMSDRDEAPPGTPGTGEAIDPKTGETYIQGIGGA